MLAVGLTVFLVALNNGTYDLTDRTSLAVGLWWAAAAAVGLRILPRERVPGIAYLAAGALALFALWTALSISWSNSAEASFNELDRVLLYLGVFAFVTLAARRGSAARWSDGLALGIVAVAVLSLLSEFFPRLVGPGAPPVFFPSEDRLSYPVNYWNGLAVLVGIAFPLILRAATASARERRRSGPTTGRVLYRALALAPIPALSAIIYLTSSRGGAATALAGVVVFCALTSPRLPAIVATAIALAGSAAAAAVLAARHQLVDGPIGSPAAAGQGRSAAILIALLCAATGLAYWAWCSVEPRFRLRLSRDARLIAFFAAVTLCVAGLALVDPIQKFNDFKASPTEERLAESDYTKAHLLSANGSGRWQIWSSAVDQWKERPLTGEGAGSFQFWWARHASLTKFVRDAHSLYVETLGELGLVGFLLIVSALGTGFVAAGRRLRAAGAERPTVAALCAALAAFVLAAGIDWMWELTVVALVGMVLLALLTGAATEEHRPPGGKRRPETLFGRLAPRAGFVAICLVAIGLEGLALLSQARLQESQDAAKRGNATAAFSSADDARALEPWASSAYLQLALLEEQAGDLAAARARIAEARDRSSDDWRLWLVSARLDVKAGLIDDARRELARAKSLNPRSPLFATSPAAR